jgi:hypothetical protein
MALYQVEINERTAVGKGILALLQGVPDTVSIEKKRVKHSKVYRDLKCAFREVKEMIDGKRPEKTIDELINEL